MVFELANIEEKRWQQQSRCVWLKEGDHNTLYFHRFASSRAAKNTISGLSHNGVRLCNTSEIKAVFLDHLKALLGSTSDTIPFEAANLYPLSLDLSQLAQPFTKEEVHTAIKSLASNRASGPDGLSNEFVKRF